MRTLMAFALGCMLVLPAHGEDAGAQGDLHDLADELMQLASQARLQRGDQPTPHSSYDELRWRAHARQDLVAPIAARLDSPDRNVLLDAMLVLDAIGAPAVEALPAIAAAATRRRVDGNMILILRNPLARLATIRSEVAADIMYVPTLERLFNHSHPAVRSWTIDTIETMGTDGRPLAPMLIEALESSPPDDVGRRCQLLCAIVETADRKTSLPLAVAALEQESTRELAIKLLIALQANAQLGHALASGDRELKLRLLIAFASRKQDVTALVPAVRRQLTAEDLELRIAAARADWHLTNDETDVLPILNDALQHPATASDGLQLFKELGGAALPSLPHLIAAVRAPEATPHQQLQSLRLIHKLGPESDQIVPLLLDIVDADNLSATIRGEAIAAIGSLGPAAAIALPRLVEIMESHAEPALRRAAINAIAAMGSEAKWTARAALLRMMRSEADSSLVVAAAVALHAVDPESSLPAERLDQLLQSSEAYDRQAVAALLKFGPQAAPATAGLVHQLKLTPQNGWARIALVKIGADALPALEQAAQSDDQHLRESALYVIQQIERQRRE